MTAPPTDGRLAAGAGDAGPLAAEQAFYDTHRRYLLHFLELDRTPFDRWLIRATLRTWDRQVALVDPALIRGRRVLEVGCGHPRVLCYFRALGARELIGCDLSAEFVRRGLTRPVTYVHDAAVPCRAGGIRFLFGDVNGPLTAGVAADTIVCFQALHHLPLPAFVETCRRILPPGGHVAIADPVGDHPLRRLGDRLGRRWGYMSPDEGARVPREVVRAFTSRGFALKRFQALNPTLEVYFLLTELLTPLSPRLAFYAKLPLAALRPVENLLERTLLRIVPRLGWRFYAEFRRGDAP